MAIHPWKEQAQKKRDEALSRIPTGWRLPRELPNSIAASSTTSVMAIPRECGILDKQEISITEDFDATELLAQMARGHLTSFQVTSAFCKRAAIAQQLTCCLTETFFDRALERAKELDAYLARTGSPVGPLHGLPISVKDSFNIKGVYSTIGFVSFLSHLPAAQNAALIDILLEAGAVLYVKTNIPQTMMTPDSHNNIFGRVLNPHKLSLTAGGSSGGEGALVAMRGSPLGIGTDIAGSVRIPALCNGVFGFKPSVGRIPYAGQKSGGRKGMVGFGPSAGPLATSARDAQLLLKVLFDAQASDLDPAALAVPWVQCRPKTRLRIGLFPEDSNVPLHPPMRRTIRESVQKLQSAGHEMVDVAHLCPSWAGACEIAFRYFDMDPERTAFKHIKASDEPVVPSVSVSYPDVESRVTPTLEELLDLNVARGEVIAAMHQLFVTHKLDVLLSPGYQSVAQPHDTFGKPVYTVLANLIDFPACVIPTGSANAEADALFVQEVSYSPPYDAAAIEGAPCHIQLMGRTLHDEELVQIAVMVEQILKS